jgi:hypothetical protein
MSIFVQVVDMTHSNDTLGVQILKARGIFVDPNWYWIGVGALLGYIMLFNVLFVLFLDWLGREYLLCSKGSAQTLENISCLALT